MKRFLFVAIAFLGVVGLVAGAALAGQVALAAKPGGNRLNLTDQQKAQIKEILDAAKAEVNKATTLRQAGLAIRQACRKAFTEVLTQDQRRLLRERRQAVRENIRQRIGQRIRQHGGQAQPQ
jgi:hypothetical protein